MPEQESETGLPAEYLETVNREWADLLEARHDRIETNRAFDEKYGGLRRALVEQGVERLGEDLDHFKGLSEQAKTDYGDLKRKNAADEREYRKGFLAEKQAQREHLRKRHDFLARLSGNSPYIGCVTEATGVWLSTPTTPSGSGSHSISQVEEEVVTRSMFNSGTIGGRVRTEDWFGWGNEGHLSQRLQFAFLWDCDREGVLEAQFLLDDCGGYSLLSDWGPVPNRASLEVWATVGLFQIGDHGVRRYHRSLPVRLIREDVHGGGWDWWGSGLTVGGSWCRGRPNTPESLWSPRMDVDAGHPVVFDIQIDAHLDAYCGAEVELGSASDLGGEIDQPYTFYSEGVVFTIAE